MVNVRQRLANLAGVGQHGHQQMHLPMGGGTQNGAQLGQKHGRVGQTPANCPQSQGRVQMRGITLRIVQRFVGTHVHRANRHRQPLHAFDRTFVGLILLFLVGQSALPSHEQKFAAKQPHAQGTRLECRLRVFGHFDVGQQLDFFAIHSDSWRIEQAQQTAALQLNLALLETVFRQNDGGGVDDDHSGIAINDDPVILAHQLARGARPDHRRDVHAARNDGGVRSLASHIGDEAGKHALFELQHVGRRQIVGDQHQWHIHRVVQQQVLLRGLSRTP